MPIVFYWLFFYKSTRNLEDIYSKKQGLKEREQNQKLRPLTITRMWYPVSCYPINVQEGYFSESLL